MDITKEWLEREYVTLGRSFADLQVELGIGKSALWRLMRKLEVRKVNKGSLVDRVWLEKRYLIDLAPTEVIAVEAGCSVNTIKSWASLWGLKRGQEFKKTAEGREHYSRPCSEAAKTKMSVSKTNLDDGYTRGKLSLGSKRQYLHRIIASESLGRELTELELVHHMDCDKTNHHPMNLLVVERCAHSALHIVMRRNAGLDQAKWLTDMGFKVEIVGDADYQASKTFRKWFGKRNDGELVVRH